jgi:hypothetical protein
MNPTSTGRFVWEATAWVCGSQPSDSSGFLRLLKQASEKLFAEKNLAGGGKESGASLKSGPTPINN